MSEVKLPKDLDNKTNFVYTELQESIKIGSKLSVKRIKWITDRIKELKKRNKNVAKRIEK
ncbi:hypothetical protein [uncultured Methanobrevibacter sp.]|uniref:hypothetical protein n=1 Tax=uncultured Methanobrevibacter sp. TaxID=253161 RepID=UPI0025D0C947|nr:hypothetical protein [uncultured Methanobrevibacter sp.]